MDWTPPQLSEIYAIVSLMYMTHHDTQLKDVFPSGFAA